MEVESHGLGVVAVYTDGAARGNPGESASGFEADKGGKMLFRGIVYNGKKTNNYAEYAAVIKALEWCIKSVDLKKERIELFSDSALVVNQINGAYKVRSGDLGKLHSRVRELIARIPNLRISNVPRETAGIRRVDAALNRFLDSAPSSKHKI